MSWSDIFYPGNPEKREQLIRKSQQFINLMEDNFYATNELIEVLNEYVGCHFSKITLNERGTLKENCDVLIQRIREIQVEVEKIDKRLKNKLEPTLYEDLKKMDLSMLLNMQKHINAVEIAIGVFGSVAAVIVCWLLKSGFIFQTVVTKIGLIASSIIGTITIGVVFLGIDMIVQAIMGSIERDQLERTLKEYDTALENFKPASKKYQYSVTQVKVTIEIMQSK
nr:single-pass membrane and coiled-coil domain-containing protein 3-like [Misgurnus anguillicaudatus]